MRWLLIYAGALASSPLLAHGPADCAQEVDDAQRLACYDRLFRVAGEPMAGGVAAHRLAEGRAAVGDQAGAPPEHPAEPPAEFNALSKFW